MTVKDQVRQVCVLRRWAANARKCSAFFCKACYAKAFGPKGYGYGVGAGTLLSPSGGQAASSPLAPATQPTARPTGTAAAATATATPGSDVCPKCSKKVYLMEKVRGFAATEARVFLTTVCAQMVAVGHTWHKVAVVSSQF